MNIISRVVKCLVVTLIAVSCQTPESTIRPKNVILLISDGTGVSQISSTYFKKESEPNYSRFNHIGLIKTSSSKEDVTDSAAGATAFASGVKTYNGAIGVDNDTVEVLTLVEIAHRKMVKTGLIATSSITHATPAAFYAHQTSRKMEEKIAVDLTKSNVDFFAGGGFQFFAQRKDSVDLLQDLKGKGFLLKTDSLVDVSDIKNESKVGFLLANNGMPKMIDGRGDFLPKATQLAIDYLNNENGFFIMAEGSQIDWGGHANDADYTITELLDFDETLGKVLDFAEKDGNTLVVVVSDHETGGFTLAGKRKKGFGVEYDDYSEIEIRFSTGGHSATLIPVFAYGPGSDAFNGVYENNQIFHKILEVTGWK